MSSLKSLARRRTKPVKPRKDFPLYAHRCGQWAKKVCGRLYYFGTWDDPVAGEIAWDAPKYAILEGNDPSDAGPGDDDDLIRKAQPKPHGRTAVLADTRSVHGAS
ncbi:hypothetical protein [Roseiconus lacunae]|uniref:WW domain-containing protein n=1 Tax=Roseiconus lacunae TaxID=2605694 RepID=A0ABT7PFJ6_9BACT|nr:hypothetical protein [Roseiconus lacunae]MDM4015267.1 hypothetical protein [Roseiconus lacunae]